MGDEVERLAKAGIGWSTYRCKTSSEALAVAADAEVVAIQSVATILDRNTISQLRRCRCIIRGGAGFDSVDFKSATEFGIMVCNTPTYCTDDVADTAWALLLSSVRHIARLDAKMRQGVWCRELAAPTRRLKGATLGIVGLGRIGGTVALRSRGWEMRVLAYDPYLTQAQADKYGAKLVSLDELLEQSDFISLHCPASDPSYHHMFSYDRFARMKPGAVLVNTSRGTVVHQEALIKALQEGHLCAAGLDVFEQEPLPKDSPLFGIDSVTITPHIAANSPEARSDLYRIICEISTDVIQGRVPQFVVNPDVLSHLRK